MESKTQRTDDREFAAIDLKPSSRVVYASFARQLETELAKANELLLKTNQAHIENQQLRKDLDGERETNQRLTDELAEALKKVDRKQDVIDQLRLDSEIYCDRLKEVRAEIERLKQELRDNNSLATRQIIPAEMAAEDGQREIIRLNAEIERKNALIEQMRTALNLAFAYIPENATDAIRISEAALSAAERGE